MVSDMNLNQVTLPSTNIEQSIAFYRGMGFTLIAESPHHVRIVEKKCSAASHLQRALKRLHAREMDFTGKSLKGFVYVEPADFAEDE